MTGALWTPGFLGSTVDRVWLKDQGLSAYANGAAISPWTDVSGNSTNATNATAGERPTMVSSAINGLPAASFDGTDDDLGITGPGNGKPCTIAFVARLTNASPVTLSRLYSQSSSLIIRVSGTSYQMLGATALSYHTGLDTNAHVHVCAFASSGNSEGRFDGTAVTGNAGTSALSSSATIGSAGTSLWIAMEMPELIILDGAVATPDLDRLDGYLAWKFGLQANLPGGHPYAAAAPGVARSFALGAM